LRLPGVCRRWRHPGGKGWLQRARAGSWRHCRRRRRRRVIQWNHFLTSGRAGGPPHTGIFLRPRPRYRSMTRSETRPSCLESTGRMLGYDRGSARCALPRRLEFARQRWRGCSDAHLGRACWSRHSDRRRRGNSCSVAAHHQDRGRLDWIVRAGHEKKTDCHYRCCTEPGRSNFPHCTPSFAVLAIPSRILCPTSIEPQRPPERPGMVRPGARQGADNDSLVCRIGEPPCFAEIV
jgi:hypothetical protein